MDIFCEIINGDERQFFYEDDAVVIVADKFPKTDIHYLVLPKKHIQSVVHAAREDEDIIGKMILAAKEFAANKGIKDYRLVFNAGKYVQVPHLHLHLIGGELPGLEL